MSDYVNDYVSLKNNYYFLSKIKNGTTLQSNGIKKDILLYKNIKKVYDNTLYLFQSTFSGVDILFTCTIYYNRITMTFILYIYKSRMYNNKYLLGMNNSRILYTTFYDIRLSEIVYILNKYLQSLPYLLNKNYENRFFNIIYVKCKKYTDKERKRVKRIISRFQLNDDCIDKILEFMI